MQNPAEIADLSLTGGRWVFYSALALTHVALLEIPPQNYIAILRVL